jgi:hypothetical protein
VGCAEVIALDQVRARQHWATLRHEWCEAKGFRFSLFDGERIGHVLRGHQGQTAVFLPPESEGKEETVKK